MQNHPHKSTTTTRRRPPRDALGRCDLDAIVPATRRTDCINWTIGFLEVSAVVIFMSVFIYLLVRHFFGIE